MPDLVTVFSRWWKFILGITLLAAVLSLIVSMFSTKEFLGEATALPANSMVADKARLFNNNIEALYSDIGTVDELDRLEGTGILDTIYIAASDSFDLAGHYKEPESRESRFKAARKLKKNTKVTRTAFGELKVKVWDEERNMAAALANFLMRRIGQIHQHLQNENSLGILQKMEEEFAKKQEQFRTISDSVQSLRGADAEMMNARKNALLEQLTSYQQAIDQYRLSIHTNPPVLLVVEHARAPLWHDKPKSFQTLIFTIVASLAVTFLMALYMESRKHRV